MNDTRDILTYSIQGFARAAELSEGELNRSKGSQTAVGILSLKSVSHFNLGIAMELMLKKLVLNSGAKKENTHLLVRLYEALPKDFQDYLEKLFRETLDGSGSIELVAFIASKKKPEGVPESKPLDNLYDFLLYFDEDVVVWEKRYSWEHFAEPKWNYYLSDVSVFVRFIERVMKSMEGKPSQD